MAKGVSKKNEVKKAAMKLGSRGGNKTKERLATDPDYYKRIGKKGGQRTKQLIELAKQIKENNGSGCKDAGDYHKHRDIERQSNGS